MKILENEKLLVEISEHGAEVIRIFRKDTKEEMLWNADPAFWGRHAPILFPFVGASHKGVYHYQGKEYVMKQHGFARDTDFEVISADDTKAVYELKSNEKTKESYPFDFCLTVTYVLKENVLTVGWNVENCTDGEMYFTIGAHPAFLYPNYEVDQPDRGYFAFDVKKDLVYRALVEKGCVGDVVRPVPLDADGLLPLNIHTFDIDTFILEDSQIKRVDLLDVEKRPYLSLTFTAPVVGLWSPPTRNAPFVCIEPWYGRCDRVDYTGEYKDRDWVWHLEPGELFDASYTIEIAGA